MEFNDSIEDLALVEPKWDGGTPSRSLTKSSAEEEELAS